MTLWPPDLVGAGGGGKQTGGNSLRSRSRCWLNMGLEWGPLQNRRFRINVSGRVRLRLVWGSFKYPGSVQLGLRTRG